MKAKTIKDLVKDLPDDLPVIPVLMNDPDDANVSLIGVGLSPKRDALEIRVEVLTNEELEEEEE